MTSTPSKEAPPDATRFPFADLLADLRRRGYGVGLDEYRDVALLASRWQGVHRRTFRDALAALIARDENEVEGIREAFDRWADAEPPPQPPPRLRLWTWHIVAVVLLAVTAAAFFTWRHFNEKNRTKPPIENVTPPPPVTTDTTAARPPKPTLPDPPIERTNELPSIAATAAGIAVLLTLAVREARRRQKDWARRYWRHILAHEPGPHHYQTNVRTSAPFPRSVVEEVAGILGRTINADGLNSDNLNVEESLRKTLRAGMAPQLVFHAPPLNVPVVVLRDTSWQMRPWEAKVDYFVRELRRQGVLLEEWYCAADPLRVSRTRHGSTISLEKLALSTSESSLMVLSSGQAVSAGSFGALNRALEVWKYRTWIHPAANPEYWRRELTSLDIGIWPMTRAGMHAAAVEISRRGDMNVPPKIPKVRSVTRGDVERMKQLLALAPAPSLEIAQEMRRRFCPDIPEEVLLFLGAEGVFYGETISFPPEHLQQLLGAASRDPKREEVVRRFLLEVLRESRPPEETAAYLRWQLDEAIQRLKLDADDTGARDTIRDLAKGPLKEEVKEAARLHGVDVSVREAPPKKLPAQPPESLGSRPPLWAWPRIGAAVLALVVIVPLTALIARSSEVGEGAPIAHLRGAYTLRWDEQAKRLFAGMTAPNLPASVVVYRDGERFTDIADVRRIELAVLPENTGAWFDVRAQLSKGNLATSFPVWVPRTEPHMTVLPEWPNDDVSRRVVEVIRRVTGIQGEITESREFANGSYQIQLFDEVDKEFGIQIPRALLNDVTLTVGALVDVVRSALAGPQAGTVVLTFVTRDRVPLGNIEYLLSSEQVMGSVAGVASKPLIVKAATYAMLVVNTNVLNRRDLGTVTVTPGQTVTQQFILRLRSQWQHDTLSRRVISFIGLQLRVPEERIFPDTDIRRDLGLSTDRFNTLLRSVMTEFDVVAWPGGAPRTAQQFVDSVRRAEKLQWANDDIGRRVVATIAKEMDVLESEVTSTAPLVRATLLDVILQDLDIEYRPILEEPNVTPQQLLDAVRAAIAAETRPVSVLLTWVTTTGQSVDGFAFEIFGGGRTYEGFAGEPVDVPPGEYKVTAIKPPMPLDVQRIAITAGQPYRREFKVDPPAAGEQAPPQLRSFEVSRSELPSSASVGSSIRSGKVISFAERADGQWVRAAGSLTFALRVLERDEVNDVKGVVIQQEQMRSRSSSSSSLALSANERELLRELDGEEGRQFFIPDIAASRNVMTRSKSGGTWELYGVITGR